MVKVYGSLTNRLLENGGTTLPEAGDGATIYLYSDRHAYTVVAVKAGKRPVVTIQRDRVIVDAPSGPGLPQHYTYRPDLDGATREVTIQRGQWREKGGGSAVRFGVRDEWYDYSL